MFFDVLLYLVCFFLFGVIPVLSLATLVGAKNNIIIYSLGFAPVVIALANVLFVKSLLAFIVLYIMLFLFFIHSVIKNGFDIYSSARENVVNIALGVAFGIGYWLYAFYPFTLNSSMYHDTIYNLAIISELKNNFPPIDSAWYTGQARLYHFLTDLYFSGMSNISSLNVLRVVEVGNLITCVFTFIMLSFLFVRSKIKNILIFIAVVVFQIASDWLPISALPGHLTGEAFSTFFWSLPIVIMLIFFWFDFYDKYRMNHTQSLQGFVFFAVVSMLMVSVGFFSKVTIATILVGLEFYSFLRFVKERCIYTLSGCFYNFKMLSTYTFIPFSVILCAFIVSYFNADYSSGGMFFGLEIKDFQDFGSWNILWPFLAVYLFPISILLLSRRFINSFKLPLLFSSIFNFVLFFIFKHIGSSDIYFIFNAILLNALFISWSDVPKKLFMVILSIGLSLVIVGIIIKAELSNGFSFPKLSLYLQTDSVYGPKVYSEGKTNEITKEMLEISKQLPKDALIATIGYQTDRHFSFAAFIGRRFWNETSSYAYTTYNSYTPTLEFQSKQDFLPSYLTSIPNPQDEKNARAHFFSMNKHKFIGNYENPADRTMWVEKLSFGDVPHDKADEISSSFGWTHVLIESRDLTKVGSWLESKEKLEKRYFTIYVL